MIANVHDDDANTKWCAQSTQFGVSKVLDFNTYPCCGHRNMADSDQQAKINAALVREAREARGWTQSRLAKEAATNQQTIGKIENAKTVQSSLLPKLANILNIDLQRLIPDIAPNGSATGPKTLIPERDIRGGVEDLPVHAAAEGGPGEIIVDSSPFAWVLRPAPLANVVKAYGIVIIGESMLPEFEPGDIALLNPHLPPVGGHTYVFYAERDGEARATIKRLVRASESLWHVRQWNPPKGQKADFTLSRKEWGKCHRVVSKNYK